MFPFFDIHGPFFHFITDFQNFSNKGFKAFGISWAIHQPAFSKFQWRIDNHPNIIPSSERRRQKIPPFYNLLYVTHMFFHKILWLYPLLLYFYVVP